MNNELPARRRVLISMRASIFAAIALLPAVLAAQPLPVPAQQQQEAQQPPAPKLAAALGWDVAKQGGFTTSVTLDAQNNVWVGTEGNGLWQYDSRKKEWTQFTTKDGLGDDCVYALAVDKLGRVWAGHLNHGVSVWNGEKWKNYGVLDGPLGSRVFAIATCPTDGDVWIATEIGVARYSLANDDWDYFTRASGLPSNQVQAIAFDAKGNIYLGMQCDGVAMADAKDNYQKWITAPGLPQMPDAPTGQGLASGLINDITMVVPPQNAVAQGESERLIAATPLGLSTSSDYGDHFLFIRGEDWQDNVKGLLIPPEAPNAQMGGGVINGGPIIIRGGGVMIFNGVRVMNFAQQANLLREDWVNCVRQEKDTGRLWVGYRQKGLEVRNFGITPSIRYDTEGTDAMDVRSIWIGAKTPALIAVYDEKNGGLKTPHDVTIALDPGDPQPTTAPAFPSPAKPPAADSIVALTKRLDFFKNELKPGDAVYLGDDWNTGGDWVGHYGTSYAMLYINERAAAGKPGNPNDPFSVAYESEPGFSTTIDIGPHHKEGDTVMDHTEDRTTDNPRVLYAPMLGRRQEAEMNDGSYDLDNYPFTWEGPDLWLTVQVPKGIHTLSLYFQNYDAHEGSQNKLRDYDIQVLKPADTMELAMKETPMARARATDFWGGVYKQFAVAGPAKYMVRIARNRSYVTKLLGVFIDRAVEDASIKRKPLPGFEKVNYTVPDLPDDLDTDNNPALLAAADLWDEIVKTADKRGAIGLQAPFGIWAYRAAAAAKAPPVLLANWRWQMCIWTQEDRDAFDKAMAEAFRALSAKTGRDTK